MSSTARFTERETGVEVSVETVFAWKPYPQTSVITYPSGRKFAMPSDDLGKHFDIVSPQEIFMTAYGGVDERPTKKQAEVQSTPAPQPTEPAQENSP